MTPAVGYLRRSTVKQELSIDGQRDEVEKFAKQNGFKIVRWYIDDGISGSTGNERPQFKKLINDAQTLKDFRAVLAYDMARFGRMDADETGYYRYQLKQAGVQVLFSNEAVGNADDEASEILRPMLQVQKRQYLRQVSRDTLRGQLQAARAGWASGRAAAYGLDRLLVDQNGVAQKRLKRGERYVKDRSWHVSLAPSDTPGEADTARWLFETYHKQEIGMREMARMLNEKGVKSPHNGDWSLGTIRELLKNPVYKGWLCFGRRGMGKFHQARNGEVRQIGSSESGNVVTRPMEDWVIHKKPDVALVSEELWDAVNAKLSSRGERSRGARVRIASYPLSGLIICGECGAVMVGTRRDNRQKYFCSGFYKAKQCGCNAVMQDNVVAVLRDMIKETLFCGGKWEALKAAITQKMNAKASSGVEDQAGLKKELAAARAQYQQAAANIAFAKPEHMQAINAVMDELRQKVKALEAKLEMQPRTAENASADDLLAHAKELFDEVMTAPTERLKAIMVKLVHRIELKFKEAPWGKRKTRVVTACNVQLYADFSFTREYRGDSRWTLLNEPFWWLSRAAPLIWQGS
jgi:site-specific DNA recombinase